jgi:hypothetical protein
LSYLGRKGLGGLTGEPTWIRCSVISRYSAICVLFFK